MSTFTRHAALTALGKPQIGFDLAENGKVVPWSQSTWEDSLGGLFLSKPVGWTSAKVIKRYVRENYTRQKPPSALCAKRARMAADWVNDPETRQWSIADRWTRVQAGGELDELTGRARNLAIGLFRRAYTEANHLLIAAYDHCGVLLAELFGDTAAYATSVGRAYDQLQRTGPFEIQRGTRTTGHDDSTTVKLLGLRPVDSPPSPETHAALLLPPRTVEVLDNFVSEANEERPDVEKWARGKAEIKKQYARTQAGKRHGEQMAVIDAQRAQAVVEWEQQRERKREREREREAAGQSELMPNGTGSCVN